MSTFVFFIVAVSIYVAFLLWCLAPLVRRPEWSPGRRLRVSLGSLLLCAMFLPLLVWPIAAIISTFSLQAGERFMAVALFPRTLPIYILNVHDRASATATVVEIVYPIEIGGARYAPVVRTACIPRRMISIDKAVDIQFFGQYPTASGGDFSAQVGNATIALDASNLLCPVALLGRLHPGLYPDYRAGIGSGPRVYVVRGEADKTQLYELRYHVGAVAVDDIVLQPPEIVRVYQTPASEVISLDALWPMSQGGEASFSIPATIEAYQRLPAQVNACVSFIIASMDFKIMTPKVERFHMTDLRDVPIAQRPAYCRDALARRISWPPMSRLAPVGS
jgi:hypothetical protein